jgi:hypothetical protein
LVAKTIKRKEKAKESSRKKWDKRIKDQVMQAPMLQAFFV